jgi:Fic family protein
MAGSGGSARSIVLPAHEKRVDPWRQTVRGGSYEDRTLDRVTVSLPPTIADLDVTVPSSLLASMDDALREIAALDEIHGEHLGSLSTLLLRAESVASSKIEHVEASVDDYARALHGVRANSSATSMVASTRALDEMIRSVEPSAGPETGPSHDLELVNVLRAHRILMAEDPSEHLYAGKVRDMQNWIGGSDHSPRGAMYVPPPPDTVVPYLDDLVTFANRDDLSVLVQAAVAHAQFESVHPFTDGNGRVGRALINTILRRRGTTRRVVVPLASAIVARRDDYFASLDAYRAGDAGPIVHAFVSASALAAEESRVTAGRLAAMPQEWAELTGRPRVGSAARRILDRLLVDPVFSAEEAEDRIGGATSSIYAAVNRLHESGVIRSLTRRTRNQIWIASSLADELDDLGVRIAARARGR